ncbi:outer membrane autotransporter barrel domain-containing protein [Verrucomicrobium sp. GAS474]|uniref:autotransporter family protein n=1 Tax=Verrucomicrobium sp. GAS474 TaxID=1882831 RepID=UPI00087A8D05|nr:autotransporter outer membrane beta-barrel domain-containing protein [Verrucomicrobium sp. GAS474]SDT87819.1 outer membrane autotransporter barrel domain-containing protein [Verrucomicrobium sp. GAS474]
MKPHFPHRLALAATLFLGTLSASLQAQTLTLPGSSTYSVTTSGGNNFITSVTSPAGTTALSAYGTIATAAVTLRFDNTSTTLSQNFVNTGSGVTFNTGSNGTVTTFNGNISGAGSVVEFKSGSGLATYILNGANTYTGPTDVRTNVILEVDGSLSATSSVTVDTGGTLRGTGSITSDVTLGSGTIISGGSDTARGTLTINGNLTLGSNSSTYFRLDSASSYSQVHSTGTVTIGTGNTLNLTPGAGVLNGNTFTVVQGDTAVTGTYARVANTLNNALSFTVSYTGTTVVVTAVQNSFTGYVPAPYKDVAKAIDSAVGDSRATTLIGSLNSLSASDLSTAFALISPVAQTTVVPTSLSVSRAAIGTLHDRMDNIRAGSTGLSLSQINLIDQNLPASALLAGTDLSVGQGVKVLAPTPKNKWGFFAATTGNFGDVDGQTTSSTYHGAGFTTGVDYRLDRAFTLGFATGYDYSKTDFGQSGSSSTVNTIRFGPYATWKDQSGDWVDGLVGGAFHWFDSDRQGYGGTAKSNTAGLEFDSGVKYGHDFKIGDNREWTLTPTFGFDYIRLAIDGYSETGSLAPLTVQDQTANSFRSNLGGIVAREFRLKGFNLTPYLTAGWSHEYLDASQAVTARLASGAGTAFTVTGDNLGHDSATYGIGLRSTLTDTVSANVSYSGEANDRYQDNSLNASIRVAF